jgi:hypothetical protein
MTPARWQTAAQAFFEILDPAEDRRFLIFIRLPPERGQFGLESNSHRDNLRPALIRLPFRDF